MKKIRIIIGLIVMLLASILIKKLFHPDTNIFNIITPLLVGFISVLLLNKYRKK